MKSKDELQAESIRIIMQFAKSGLDKGEGMVILAMTLATLFRTDGVSQHEAINRFTTIVKNVYGELK
jgi:hypothetical protein